MEITKMMISKGSRREVTKHFQTKNGNTYDKMLPKMVTM